MDEALARTIGGRVRVARDRAAKSGHSKFTQGRLAEEVGVTDETISRIERGELLPALDTLVRIARALGVDLDFLVGTRDTAKSVRRARSVRLETVIAQCERLAPDALRAIGNVIALLPPVGKPK